MKNITRDELYEGLKEIGLGLYAKKILLLTEDCLRFKLESAKETALPVGASRFGGLPDLPSDVTWPTYNESPLSFLLQLNLEELSEYSCCAALPSSGVLSFFYDVENMAWGYDPNDRGSWRVLYTMDTTNLRRREPPDDLEEDYIWPTTMPITFSEEISTPSLNSIALEQLKFTDDEMDHYVEYIYRLEGGDQRAPLHQVLGHPEPVQNEMQLECQLVSNGVYYGSPEGSQDPRARDLEPGATSWRLLLQLDSDDDVGFMWGDVGMLYFWIHENDLTKHDYSNVWMILQCH
jgi:uncharacterized protein YwqG